MIEGRCVLGYVCGDRRGDRLSRWTSGRCRLRQLAQGVNTAGFSRGMTGPFPWFIDIFVHSLNRIPFRQRRIFDKALNLLFCSTSAFVFKSIASVAGTRESIDLFLGFRPRIGLECRLSKSLSRVLPGTVNARTAFDQHRIRDFWSPVPRHWARLVRMRFVGRMVGQFPGFLKRRGAKRLSHKRGASIVAMAGNTLNRGRELIVRGQHFYC